MSLRAHRLNPDADHAFLADQRVDPVAGRAFEPGDLVVVCASCASPMLAETWVVLGGAHCGQTETADRLPVAGRALPSDARASEAGPLDHGPEKGVQTRSAPSSRDRRWPLVAAVVLCVAVAISFLAVRYALDGRGADGAADRASSSAALLPLDAAPPGAFAVRPGIVSAETIPGPAEAPEAPVYSPGTLIANSPGDGFVALRSEPSVRRGRRVARIPHGTPVQIVGTCGYAETIGGRGGSWCEVDFAGQQGWAFTGFMTDPSNDSM